MIVAALFACLHDLGDSMSDGNASFFDLFFRQAGCDADFEARLQLPNGSLCRYMLRLGHLLDPGDQNAITERLIMMSVI